MLSYPGLSSVGDVMSYLCYHLAVLSFPLSIQIPELSPIYIVSSSILSYHILFYYGIFIFYFILLQWHGSKTSVVVADKTVWLVMVIQKAGHNTRALPSDTSWPNRTGHAITTTMLLKETDCVGEQQKTASSSPLNLAPPEAHAETSFGPAGSIQPRSDYLSSYSGYGRGGWSIARLARTSEAGKEQRMDGDVPRHAGRRSVM